MSVSADMVKDVLAMRRGGQTFQSIAGAYGINVSTVHRIATGKARVLA